MKNKKMKIKKRLGAVAKPKVLRKKFVAKKLVAKKLVAKKLEISDIDIKPAEVKSVIRRRSVHEDEETKSWDTTVIALIFFSLLISFAYTTCFHFLYQYISPLPTDKIKEVPPANDIPVPVESSNETYSELEKRLKVVERLVEEYKAAVPEYQNFMARLEATKPVLEEIFMNSYGLTYSMYDNGISSHEDMIEDIKSINQAYAKLNQSLKSVESVAEDLPIESMEQTNSELKKRLNTAKSLIADALSASWIPDLHEERLETTEALVKDVETADNIQWRVNKMLTTVESIEKAAKLRKTFETELSRDLNAAQLKAKVAALLSLKKPDSCDTISTALFAIGVKGHGIFQIFPRNIAASVYVFCDASTDGGRWTVFQRRLYGAVNFNRNWFDYVEGFGVLETDFWLGLETIYQLIAGKRHELRIEMTDWNGKKMFAKYSDFALHGASDKYRLRVGGYSGSVGDSFSYHNNMQFSTRDADNDPWSLHHCANYFGCGWWFNMCFKALLNGRYYRGGPYGDPKKKTKIDGISWRHYKHHYYYSMNFVEMKFRVY